MSQADKPNDDGLHEDEHAAYEHVNNTPPDYIVNGFGHAWYGYRMREAFLAGVAYEQARDESEASDEV